MQETLVRKKFSQNLFMSCRLICMCNRFVKKSEQEVRYLLIEFMPLILQGYFSKVELRVHNVEYKLFTCIIFVLAGFPHTLPQY